MFVIQTKVTGCAKKHAHLSQLRTTRPQDRLTGDPDSVVKWHTLSNNSNH